jgi:hypothetical protein
MSCAPEVGGTLGATLFSSLIRPEPRLWWSVKFNYEEVARPEGSTMVDLVIDSMPLPRVSWRDLAGVAVTNEVSGRDDRVVLLALHVRPGRPADRRAGRRRPRQVRVVATVAGDVDGLGIDTITADAWLTSTGIAIAVDPAPASAMRPQRSWPRTHRPAIWSPRRSRTGSSSGAPDQRPSPSSEPMIGVFHQLSRNRPLSDRAAGSGAPRREIPVDRESPRRRR